MMSAVPWMTNLFLTREFNPSASIYDTVSNLLTYKEGKISDSSQFLKMVEAILEFGPFDSRVFTWNQEFEYHTCLLKEPAKYKLV